MSLTYITRTAELGRCVFTAPSADDSYAGYVFLDAERGYAATQSRQICYGGGFDGSTVQSTAADLKADSQRWLRDRRRVNA
jgi:hypothetical protein